MGNIRKNKKSLSELFSFANKHYYGKYFYFVIKDVYQKKEFEILRHNGRWEVNAKDTPQIKTVYLGDQTDEVIEDITSRHLDIARFHAEIADAVLLMYFVEKLSPEILAQAKEFFDQETLDDYKEQMDVFEKGLMAAIGSALASKP